MVFPELFGYQQGKGLADYLFGGIAKNIFCRAVPGDYFLITINSVDGISCTLYQ